MFIERFAPYGAASLKRSQRAKVPGWKADLVRDGQCVAKVDMADTNAEIGCVFTTVRDRHAFDAHMASLPKDFFDSALADADTARALFVLELMDAEMQRGQLQELCRDHTCFRLKGDMEDAWRELDVPFSPLVARRLRTQFGNALQVIANEHLEQAVVGTERGHAN